SVLVRKPGITKFEAGKGLYAADIINHIALDPENWSVAVAVDDVHVWLTVDGTQWWDITGNLTNFAHNLEAVELVREGNQLVVAVGGNNGVYRAFLGDISGTLLKPNTVWTRFGTEFATVPFPNVQVTDLQYD